MNLPLSLLVGLLAIVDLTPLPPGDRVVVPLGDLKAGKTYGVQVALEGPIGTRDRVGVAVSGPDGWRSSKALNEGDPDLSLWFRPTVDGEGSLEIRSDSSSGPVQVRTRWSSPELSMTDQAAIEAEPNDSWRQANPLRLGRAVYGMADDVDYLDNPDEGQLGLDWFRIVVVEDAPVLVFFQLDSLDRDLSANLKVHRLDPASGEVRPFEVGKDPMEMVHDRESERYSTHLSRTLTRGTYFVEVNANHPDYILRTRTYPAPPSGDPSEAVEAGLDYLLEIGDAWFAQIPREGNITSRSKNLHDTATRCTACHASSFPTEASLVGLANGYPIRAKSSMLTLMDRLANSPTPLYGEDGLYWQRFIAIPLQSQGKQGGIVLDFERQVLGRETPEFARFGPFLQASWRGRRSLPADEVNGVVPLDSKFGLAWRDWRVLTEMTNRTRRVAYAQAADAIADILDDPATDRQVETLQDRIHRLYAWWLIDKDHFAPRIQAEAEALRTLQNPDGGWHELDRKPGPSAVYTTGQLTWTLLKIGQSRDDPRIARALGYLLATRQHFGGWFQTTTHENFRTPMRETRYAVEALAEAFPRPGAPKKGWGNRDGQAARPPRDGSMVEILDDLENLWEVADADRPTIALKVARFLGHPEPMVRARAAAALGRLGDPESVGPLVGRLNDPSKIVWRAAAWALRRLGNQGFGIEAIKAALADPDPATRRGALRIFAYQFSGMDGRLDLADCLIARSSDPDLWTRLQALRSLRQWFYRSNDAGFRRRIVNVYLDRMAVADVPVVRKALVEGMYILLDENLGGGVSLSKNLAILPEKFRRKALEGREAVERDVLLGPILAALESGNALQREALVRSFDGSFLKGRTYARRPTGMIDVGNDREFGFLIEPPSDVLDRTFAALLTSDSPPDVRRQAIQLARFFLVPERSTNPSIPSALLKGMADPDPTVREAARAAVGHDLELRGLEGDPDRLALVRASIQGSEDDDRRAIVRAIARSPSLLARPEILEALRARLAVDAAGSLWPVLGHPAFSDAEVLASVARAWPKTHDLPDRLGLLDALLARPGLLDRDEPSSEVASLLRLVVVDSSSSVREKALGAIGGLSRLRSSRVGLGLLLSSLADDSPALRRIGLELAAPVESFWNRPDALERLLALLVDPDPSVREQALAVVERRGLARGSPKMARRVKALSSDPKLKVRAEACLKAEGFDPAILEPDVRLARPRLLSVSTFRTRVNPLFFQVGEDGVSCARCHANHSVFRVGDPADSLMTHYNSALKVINLGDPESSLLLRKPRSPQGQGAPDPSSPTGLTHVGGPRWEDVEHPAYRAILAWIREAATEAASDPVANAVDGSTDNHAPGYPPSLALDGDPSTFWQTEFTAETSGTPHELTLDLGSSRRLDGLIYIPRQDSSRGRVQAYEILLSVDGKGWSAPVARGDWPDEPTYQYVVLSGRPARFVKLRGLSEVNRLPLMSVAELAIDSHP